MPRDLTAAQFEAALERAGFQHAARPNRYIFPPPFNTVERYVTSPSRRDLLATLHTELAGLQRAEVESRHLKARLARQQRAERDRAKREAVRRLATHPLGSWGIMRDALAAEVGDVDDAPTLEVALFAAELQGPPTSYGERHDGKARRVIRTEAPP